MPEFLAAARPEVGLAGLQGASEGLLVHVGHHEHLERVSVLHHGGNQAACVELEGRGGEFGHDSLGRRGVLY